MKILYLANHHLKNRMPDKKQYGCVCPQCGSVFIFDESEISKSRCINPKPKYIVIQCPNTNCNGIITMNNSCIKELKNADDRRFFEHYYDE